MPHDYKDDVPVRDSTTSDETIRFRRILLIKHVANKENRRTMMMGREREIVKEAERVVE